MGLAALVEPRVGQLRAPRPEGGASRASVGGGADAAEARSHSGLRLRRRSS